MANGHASYISGMMFVYRLDTLKLECDRHGVPHVNCLSVHLAGDKVGKRLNHAHCLLVEVGVPTTGYLNFTHLTGLGNNELNRNTTLDVVFHCHGGYLRWL